MEKKNNINTNFDSDETEVTRKKVADAPAVEKNPMKASKVGSTLWKSVLVGGVPGILIGASGTAAVTDVGGNGDEVPHPGNDDGEFAPIMEIHEAHSVSDAMTFDEAFAAARAEVGPRGAFCWHGQVYGTHRADEPEWQTMTDEERAQHSQAILAQVHPAPYTPTENEPVIEPNQLPNDETGDQESPVEVPQDEVEGEIDVHIVGVENVELPDGTEAQVGIGEVDGMDAMFIDTTGDGEVDTVLIDIDGDGEASIEEAFDSEGAGIMMEDIQAEAELATVQMPDDQLYAGMPDYTNDADVSSLA